MQSSKVTVEDFSEILDVLQVGQGGKPRTIIETSSSEACSVHLTWPGFAMTEDDERRKVLSKRLLAEARQDGNVEELLTDAEFRDDEDDFLFDINCIDMWVLFLSRSNLLRKHAFAPPFYAAIDLALISRPFISPPSRVRSSSCPPLRVSLTYFAFCLHHDSVLSHSIENVTLLIEADGCDVDPQNFAGDTPLHLAVRIQDRDIRRAIVSALVEIAGAIDSYVSVARMACLLHALTLLPYFSMDFISIWLTNKAGQTPNALSKIYCPNDTEVSSLTTPPARQVHAILDEDDIASGELAEAFFGASLSLCVC
ncbi:hypothetical protein J3R83DRAFT_5957 [Lanmaoa asiatica]|nr:hypothetical protein J3R83DRAFT_5957 [Lanmaoa asiatica]